jgi:hypothetical protein
MLGLVLRTKLRRYGEGEKVALRLARSAGYLCCDIMTAVLIALHDLTIYTWQKDEAQIKAHRLIIFDF